MKIHSVTFGLFLVVSWARIATATTLPFECGDHWHDLTGTLLTEEKQAKLHWGGDSGMDFSTVGTIAQYDGISVKVTFESDGVLELTRKEAFPNGVSLWSGSLDWPSHSELSNGYLNCTFSAN